MKLITNLTSTPKAKKTTGGQKTLNVQKTEKKTEPTEVIKVATGKENEQ